MHKLAVLLCILTLAACAQPVEPAPVINNYYTIEAAPVEEPPAEVPVVEAEPVPEPAPAIPREITDYERYAMYVIDPDGAIFCESHCEEWEISGYPSQADYFAAMLPLFRLEAQQHGAGWLCISGELYPAI